MSAIYASEPATSGKVGSRAWLRVSFIHSRCLLADVRVLFTQVLLVTTMGDLDIELWCKEAPLACRNFIQLCMEGYYDNTIFHRIVKARPAPGVCCFITNLKLINNINCLDPHKIRTSA
jgi:hypothetical protein